MGGIYSLQLHALSSKFHKMEYFFIWLFTYFEHFFQGGDEPCICVCWWLPTNQGFYRLFARYGKGVGHHKVGQVMNGGQLPTNQLHDIINEQY